MSIGAVNMKVIEMNTREREQEIIDLFESIKPLLDEGYSYNKALRKVKNLTSVNTNNAWYRNVIEYGESQGYSKKDYSYGRRMKNDK